MVKISKENDKIVRISTTVENNSAIICIVDNGGGINDKIIDKIFEPYFTTKHQSQGTGIGLYMSHEIIIKHFKGNITASNVEFEYKDKTYNGAKFKIELPLNEL